MVRKEDVKRKSSITIFTAKGSALGQVRYHRELQSAGLRYPRDVIVWLPPSYRRTATRRYPVVYMHDGQNLFDPATAFAGQDWAVDQAASKLILSRRIEEPIIVGIYNTRDRIQEYSISPTGLRYAQFIAAELKPFIDRTYRTKPDAANTGVMGSSMGGLCSFLLAWWYPQVFSMAGCMSSSFLWNDNQIIKEVFCYSGPKKNIRIYLDVGTEEHQLIPGFEQMVSLLKQKGYKKGEDLEYYLSKGAR